jgi:hypothetical protein
MPTACAIPRFRSNRLASIVPFTIAVLLGGVTGAAAQERGAVIQRARQLQWSAAGQAGLRDFFTDVHVVRTFLNEIQTGGDGSEPGTFAAVKEYRFVDLDNDGWLELVALVDVSGREFFNSIEIVHQSPAARGPRDRLAREYEGFALETVHGFEIDSLDAALKDLDNDGRYEIVVKDLVGAYQGTTRPNAVIPEIYGWTGDRYEKTSSRFPAYYRQIVLPELERALQNANAIPEATLNPPERNQLRLERAKYAAEIAAVRARLGEK